MEKPRFGAQAYVIKETRHQVAVRLAEEIGNTIVLETPVRKIAQDTQGVTVISEKSEWRAELAIVAIPLPLCANSILSAVASGARFACPAHAVGFGHQMLGGI